MTHTFTYEEFLFLVQSAVYSQGKAPPKSPLKYIPPAFFSPFFSSTYFFTFSSFFLFPSEKHRGWGLEVSCGSKLKRVPLGGRGGGGNLAGVQQVFAFMITAESTPLLISAVDSFRGTGGRQIWSVSAVKVSLSALVPLLSLHGRSEVELLLKVHYLCLDCSQPVKIVRCKWKLDLISVSC